MAGGSLFAAQRIEMIKEILYERKLIDVATLCSMLNVSDVTVRKDLDKLEAAGFLIKEHGGAMLANQATRQETEPVISNAEQKALIAKIAATMVEPGDTVFLGQGPTCLMLARELCGVKGISVVTNNVNAAVELNRTMNNVLLVGGSMVLEDELSHTVGMRALEYMKSIRLNKAYLSVFGVDLVAGYTVLDEQTQILQKAVMECSRQCYVLAEYEKFNKVGPYQFGEIDAFPCVISNNKVDLAYKEFFFNANIKFLTTYDIAGTESR